MVSIIMFSSSFSLCPSLPLLFLVRSIVRHASHPVHSEILFTGTEWPGTGIINMQNQINMAEGSVFMTSMTFCLPLTPYCPWSGNRASGAGKLGLLHVKQNLDV